MFLNFLGPGFGVLELGLFSQDSAEVQQVGMGCVCVCKAQIDMVTDVAVCSIPLTDW